MTIYYLDSSAWLKRYFAEPGSRWMRNLFARQEGIASSLLAYVEVAAALARQLGTREPLPVPRDDLRNTLELHWREFLKVEIDDSVFHRAQALAWEKRLRGADAIHLAAADWLRGHLATRSVSLTMLTADAELIAAARSIHLEVLDPSGQA